ncbi:uncharacterized protein LOC103162368 [Cricetulus griseus]|uniref:Uncharacterized protein LOC103162368 n=1 Tax=Cricetulus griseus TaxID=10029 RepID=A0A9J7H6C9_CRIGR|nr:uncharacterized protein LOC103162368 [Cricetulus griseus]
MYRWSEVNLQQLVLFFHHVFQHLAPARLRGRGSTAGHARCEHELWRAHCPAVRSARPEGEGAFALGALGPGPPTLVLLFAFALQLLYRETKGPRRLEMRPRSGEPSGLNPGPGPAGKMAACPGPPCDIKKLDS